MDVATETSIETTKKLSIETKNEPRITVETQSAPVNLLHSELLAKGLASPVSQAFGGHFTIFPIDNPPGEYISLMTSAVAAGLVDFIAVYDKIMCGTVFTVSAGSARYGSLCFRYFV